jgi:tripartite-type tricarboxylate transporter receptor subunit TctC
MPINRRHAGLATCAALLTLAVSSAGAQAPAWPSRAIKIVTPSPVGVGSDTFARAYADQLGKALGVPVIVENKPGAAMTIGADAVAKAPADGYTLFFAPSNPFTIVPFLFTKLPYNAQRDLVPITQTLKGGSFIVAASSFPINSLKELVAQAKAHPGKFSFASYGAGSTSHVGFELLMDTAGIELLHVPYRQSAMPDLMGGQISLGFEPPVSAIPLVKSGKIKALAYTGSKRSPAMPDVPTLAELYPGLEMFSWQGMWAPAGVPPAVLQRLHTEITRITRTPEMTRRIVDNGMEPMATTPEETSALLQQESTAMGRIIKAKGIKLD